MILSWYSKKKKNYTSVYLCMSCFLDKWLTKFSSGINVQWHIGTGENLEQ